MKWAKRLAGLVFSILILRLGVLSIINEESMVLGSSGGSYQVSGWMAIVMGAGWIGLGVCVFSFCCLGEKLERGKWHMVGGKLGLTFFGVCLCVVAAAAVANMV